jgi:hypothetical protein
MIYLQIQETQILSTSKEFKTGLIEYIGDNEYQVLVNPSDYEYVNNEVQAKWLYPQRPIKVILTHPNITRMQLSEFSEFIKIGLSDIIPKVVTDTEVILYLEELQNETMSAEDVRDILVNNFDAVVIDK